MKKRIACLSLVALLVCSLAVPAMAAPWGDPYLDYVPEIPDWIQMNGNGQVTLTAPLVDSLSIEAQAFMADFYEAPYFVLLAQGFQNPELNAKGEEYDKKFRLYFVKPSPRATRTDSMGDFIAHNKWKRSTSTNSGIYDTPPIEFKPYSDYGMEYLFASYNHEAKKLAFGYRPESSTYPIRFSYVLTSSALSGTAPLYPYANIMHNKASFTPGTWENVNAAGFPKDRYYDWWLGRTGGSITIPPPIVVDPDTDIDTDGDGKPDINIDTDGDGKPDTNIDTNGDKKPDVNIDTDGDGKPDINIDTDGDNRPDINIDTNDDKKPDINIDTNGNKKPDLNIDTNGDKKPDTNIDTNGDKKPDINIDVGDCTCGKGTNGKPSGSGSCDCGNVGDKKPDVNIDNSGNGKPDTNVDTNGDGKPDTNIDTNGNKKPDTNIDLGKCTCGKGQNNKPSGSGSCDCGSVGDGKPDINVDTDSDGKPDTNIDIGDCTCEKGTSGKPSGSGDCDCGNVGDGKPDINLNPDYGSGTGGGSSSGGGGSSSSSPSDWQPPDYGEPSYDDFPVFDYRKDNTGTVKPFDDFWGYDPTKDLPEPTPMPSLPTDFKDYITYPDPIGCPCASCTARRNAKK